MRSELAVVPWKRPGQDRLYVNGTGGQSLGWLDQLTGNVRVEAEQDRQAVLAALHLQSGVPFVRTWSRGGAKRLYVSTGGAQGRDLGWGDVLTGEVVTEPGADPGVVRRALACHRDWQTWREPDEPHPTGNEAAAGKGPGLLRRLLGR